MYVPRDERLTRIEPSELGQPWLESEFSLDDVLRYSGEVEDHDHRLLGVDPRPEGFTGVRAYVVEHVPRRGVPAPWGSIVSWIETEHGTPLRREYRDAAGEAVRVLRYGDIREVQGRRFPHLWRLRGTGRRARESRIFVETIRFEADFEESVFTTTNLTSAD